MFDSFVNVAVEMLYHEARCDDCLLLCGMQYQRLYSFREPFVARVASMCEGVGIESERETKSKT